MGAEVLLIDANTKEQIMKFEPFPDNPKEWDEHRAKNREYLERTNKIILEEFW